MNKSIAWDPPELKYKDLINDSYRKSRGGNAKLITIYCAQCNCKILLYQKDGKGNPYRCYIDRIIYPAKYRISADNIVSIKDVQPLKCDYCSNSIGTPMIYKKEKRLAFGLFKGKFYKRDN